DDKFLRFVGERSGSHHEHAGSTLRGGNTANFTHHRHADTLYPPVLALHEVTIFTDACHQIDAAVGHATAALLDRKSLAPEEFRHQILEFTPRQALKRGLAMIR